MIVGTFNPMWVEGMYLEKFILTDKYMKKRRVSFTVVRRATLDEYLEQLSNDGVTRHRPIPINAHFWHVRLNT